jgi:hypothetical protein
VDETRSLTRWAYHATVRDGVIDCLDRRRLDCWAGEPPPLILTESSSSARHTLGRSVEPPRKTRMRTSSRRLISVALVAMTAAACSSTGPGSTTSPSPAGASPSTAASSPSSPVASLVGRWKQGANVHTCGHYVRGMDEEGLLEAVESSPPYVPGESWQQVAEQFCNGSLEDWDVDHYHFFTAEGLFGSLNQDEQQVDDGTYKILDTHTFSIGPSKFRYTVRGDTLKMDPNHGGSA